MKTLLFLVLLLGTFSTGWCDFYDITSHNEPVIDVACESWRLNAEVGNIVGWKVIPPTCEHHISNYFLGGQYISDVQTMAQEAMSYVRGLALKGDGKDAWVFDIDDTALTHIAYYSQNHFGAIPFNRTAWVEWETRAEAPAITSVLSLYNLLIESDIKVIFLTGRDELRRNVTEENLLHMGFSGWTSLILRQELDRGLPAKVYKSAKRVELEQQGYRIWGNMGDQWSDLTGFATGERVFKVPNPMYFIA